jgi:antitoxin component YwqK of YwqJK toxin-antitoxin module
MKTFTHKLLLGVGLTSVLGLAACGDKVLDYRNVQISNGQIFAGDENKPFSGHLTNMPGRQITLSQGAATRVMGYVRMGGGDPGSFSASLCDVEIKDGYLEGKATCKDPYKDVVRYRMSFKSGALDGEFTMYSPTGDDTMVKAAFDNGRPDGEEKTYDAATGKLIADLNWDHGIVKGKIEQFDATTGNKILETSKDEQGLDDGDYIQYSPDGTVIHKVHYDHGMKNGSEDVFYPNGKPKQHVELQNDRANGAWKEWNVDGNLTKDAVYENGMIASSSDSPVQAAVKPAVEQPAPALAALTSTASEAPAKRCGWIENSLPGGDLTLQDRDGTWIIIGGDSGGTPDGFDRMPATNKGSACGCVTVETNRQAMRIIKVLGGTLIPDATCQRDTTLK